MHNVQEYNVHYNNVVSPDICVDILLPYRKHLHDCIISIRREVLTNKASLTTPPFIEVIYAKA